MDPRELRVFLDAGSRLFSLAYRMLGSASEAEDIVQEVFLRWADADRGGIVNADAWLTTVAVNLCRNELVSARARRERYVGPWLPEPVPTGDGRLGPLDTAQQRDDVSLALLTAMERLAPVERAVFVLRSAFGYPHREIADMLDLTEANAQQIFHRAGERVRSGRPRFPVPPERARAVLDRFLLATATGDVSALRSLLADDVVSTADGGGQVTAARRPVVGADLVARYLLGLRRMLTPTATLAFEEVNGSDRVLVMRDAGAVTGVVDVTLDGDRIAAIRFVVNPRKLAAFAT
ncbi:RNA polymerase sigma-70 factor [Nocardia thailandica]